MTLQLNESCWLCVVREKVCRTCCGVRCGMTLRSSSGDRAAQTGSTPGESQHYSVLEYQI